MVLNKLFKKIKIIFIISFVLVVGFVKPNYSFFVDYYTSNNVDAPLIMLTGDSYAGYLATYEAYKDLNILIYAQAGKTTEDNFNMMQMAINTMPKIVVISIGVNDHSQNIKLEDFKNRISYLVNECRQKTKKVILHTYMEYDEEEFGDGMAIYDVKDYDNILRDIAESNSNTFYIDMSDYNDQKYLQDDRIHYNKVFYDELYNRLTTAIMLMS